MKPSDNSKKLRAQLKQAGLSDQIVNAAWPSWWSEEAAASPSANAELRFTIARKLGIEPTSLLDDEVDFVWDDVARFKGLSDDGSALQSVIASFGVALARLLFQCTPASNLAAVPSANDLRQALLSSSQFIDLSQLIATCWGIGIPVIYLRIFPLMTKAMDAMIVHVDGRTAIMLAKDAQYPAPVAFTLAHELGHAALGHIGETGAIVDFEQGAMGYGERDQEEQQANQYALVLLTGMDVPEIKTSLGQFNSAQLADAALRTAAVRRIEPGTLALCYAYATGAWPLAMTALKFIYAAPKPAWAEINNFALHELDLSNLPPDAEEYLLNIMGVPRE